MSETDNQFRALIDRILRSREAEDEAKQDTKEIYAEAKSSGYDKTAMGALVRELRSKDKNPAKFEEKSATLDLYRDAYERALHVHAREGSKKSTTSKGESDAKSAEAACENLDLIGRRLGVAKTGAGHQPLKETPTNTAPDESAADEISSPISHSLPATSPGHAAKAASPASHGDAATLQHGALA